MFSVIRILFACILVSTSLPLLFRSQGSFAVASPIPSASSARPILATDPAAISLFARESAYVDTSGKPSVLQRFKGIFSKKKPIAIAKAPQGPQPAVTPDAPKSPPRSPKSSALRQNVADAKAKSAAANARIDDVTNNWKDLRDKYNSAPIEQQDVSQYLADFEKSIAQLEDAQASSAAAKKAVEAAQLELKNHRTGLASLLKG